MKKYYFILFLSVFITQAYCQDLVRVHLLSSKTPEEIKSKFDSWGVNTSGIDFNAIKSYKINYSTVDVHGNATVASGAIYIPQLPSCNYLPLISWQHGTEYDKTTVPSETYEFDVGLLFSGSGYIVTMPDYLGMGDNPGIHPYHHAESEATASIDLIRACRKFMNDSLHIQDNNQIFLSGYSQGGHATMAIHKYIQDNNLYSEFNLIASAPLSGAYDLSGAQFDLIFNDDSTYLRPEFLPYLLASYQMIYGNVYNSYDQIYKPPYDAQISSYLSENHTNYEWFTLLPPNYYEFMQDSVIDNMLADNTRDSHPILKDLRLNNLYNWVPERPVKMLYCGMDKTVSPQNSLNALNSMTALGATKVEAIEIDPNGIHQTCYYPSLFYAFQWFNSLVKPCELISNTAELINENKFKIFPNPAINKLYIDYNNNLDVKIFSMDGKLKMATSFCDENYIDISNFQHGVYLIVARDAALNKVFHSVFIKK